MKKVISLFLALTFVFTLAACSNNQPQTNDSAKKLRLSADEFAKTPPERASVPAKINSLGEAIAL